MKNGCLIVIVEYTQNSRKRHSERLSFETEKRNLESWT